VNERIARQLRELLGEAAVERTADDLPRVLPGSTEAVAATCAAAHASGWRVRVEGHGSWLPPDAPADVVISTAGLNQVTRIDAADLVATAQAGAPLARLQLALAAEGMWLPIDPPGRPRRSIGSVVATGTAGPLRHRHGPVRDQVLGCTIVTGDGRVVQAGGRVGKNVAGYDLVKLQAGGFGAFGIMTELHLRLRALPAWEMTLVAQGERDSLTLLARELRDANLDAAAIELLSPAVADHSSWVLGVRVAGTADAVWPAIERGEQLMGHGTSILTREQATPFWQTASRAMGGGMVALRFGVLPDGLDETLDLLHQRVGLGLVSAGAAEGGLRWCGESDVPTMRELRQRLAAREVPVTLERAPWRIRRITGHFGLYREGVAPLVGQLRRQFDPGDLLQVALDADDDLG
jgi:glycolate oxidase FAD binding subunit